MLIVIVEIMQEFFTNYFEYIIAALVAILGTGGVLLKIRNNKSKKVNMKNIKTKSGDVIAGNKTTYKNAKKNQSK